MPDKAVTFLRLLGDLEELENFIDEVANHSKLSILKRRLQKLEELKVKFKDFVDEFDSINRASERRWVRRMPVSFSRHSGTDRRNLLNTMMQ